MVHARLYPVGHRQSNNYSFTGEESIINLLISMRVVYRVRAACVRRLNGRIRSRYERTHVRFRARIPTSPADSRQYHALAESPCRLAGRCPLNGRSLSLVFSSAQASGTFDEQIRPEIERLDHVDLRDLRREVNRKPSDDFEEIRIGCYTR